MDNLNQASINGSTTYSVQISTTYFENKLTPKSLSIVSSEGKEYTVAITTKNPDHLVIIRAIVAAFESEWFDDLVAVTQLSTYSTVYPLINWFNTFENIQPTSERYQYLKEYDTFRRNEIGARRSYVGRIKKIISTGLETKEFSKSESAYLRYLMRVSKDSLPAKTEAYTLTQWFNRSGLRETLGEKKFLQLESPRLLISSFRTTAAVTLLFLLECREDYFQKLSSSPTPFKPPPSRFQGWNHYLLKTIGTFNGDGCPSDNVTATMWADLVLEQSKSELEKIISCSGIEALPLHRDESTLWLPPKLFSPAYAEAYSRIEERLCAWLIACLAVQPTDIQKLTPSNFASEFNKGGRLTLMQIKYFKGRAGNEKETNLMLGSECWTQAIYKYLKRIAPSERLFKSEINKSFAMPICGQSVSTNSEINLLHRIWTLPEVQKRLHLEFERSQTTPLFLNAMQALAQLDAKEHERDVKINRNVSKYLFKLAHIKTTAVHAGSDKYRESDLINHHSHTSQTEKHSYLTDANKDWVNQCGRITRMVLHDLQNIVYQPSIDLVRKSVLERLLKTRLLETPSVENGNIKSIESIAWRESDVSHDYDLIVNDSIDTAIYFFHYIKQAELAFEKLNRSRPDFVERTLLIQIEWMTQVLGQMKSAKEAQSKYVQICKYLPPLFNHLVDSIE